MTNHPTNLHGPKMRATRNFLLRLAAGEEVITRFYTEPSGMVFAHRRGFILSRRYGAKHWRHELTAVGRAALAAAGRP